MSEQTFTPVFGIQLPKNPKPEDIEKYLRAMQLQLESKFRSIKSETDALKSNALTVNVHSYASGHADWTLSPSERLIIVHKVTGADAVINAIIPLSPFIEYRFINASGYALTVKGASGTGITIANTKTATVAADGTNVVRMTPDA